MDDAIFSYARGRISAKLESCAWEDSVGQAFESAMVPELYRSIDVVAAAGEDLQKAYDQLERKIRECNSERKF